LRVGRTALREQKKGVPILENAMAETRKRHDSAKALNLTHMMSIYNVALYLLILHRDIQIIKLEYVSTLENWKLKFYARELAVAIDEAMDDLPTMLRRNRQSLAAIDFAASGKRMCRSRRQNFETRAHRSFDPSMPLLRSLRLGSEMQL
jgi:hypothetical protein